MYCLDRDLEESEYGAPQRQKHETKGIMQSLDGKTPPPPISNHYTNIFFFTMMKKGYSIPRLCVCESSFFNISLMLSMF
jgi:hypothetical protein